MVAWLTKDTIGADGTLLASKPRLPPWHVRSAGREFSRLMASCQGCLDSRLLALYEAVRSGSRPVVSTMRGLHTDPNDPLDTDPATWPSLPQICPSSCCFRQRKTHWHMVQEARKYMRKDTTTITWAAFRAAEFCPKSGAGNGGEGSHQDSSRIE